MNAIAVIPARAGSKGIPGKNIRPLLGKPLLAYSIEQALASGVVSRVFVSTDGQEIADVAKGVGAEVVWRPAEISGDQATSESALEHALQFLEREERFVPDAVVFLQATSPMRKPDDIADAMARFVAEGADSLLSVCRVHGFVWRESGGQVASFSYDHRNRPRRQDAPVDYVENGSIYIFKPWVLRKHQNRLGGKVAIHPMAEIDSFQIDEPSDLALIENLMRVAGRVRPAVARLAGVELLALDFDGVMTDNTVVVSQDGGEAAVCHRGDGWGIARLKEQSVEVVVISTEQNPVVQARCAKLGLPCVHGVDDKLAVLKKYAADRSLSPAQVAYVGNDVNDRECMQWAGFSIAVGDAFPEIRRLAGIVTNQRGGRGAVREVCDMIIAAKRGLRDNG